MARCTPTRLMATLSAGVVSACAGAAAHAEVIVGMTSGGTLVSFDTANPGTALSTSPQITGLSQGDSIVDIDYFPVDNGLYGLGSATGTLYRLDRFTGVATPDSVAQTTLGDVRYMDFNPAADRVRVFSANNANYRLTPGTGTAGSTGANSGFVDSDGTFSYGVGGPTPNLVALAYNNNFDGAPTTALYSLDADSNALVTHTGGPQFNSLNNVGTLSLLGNPFDLGTSNVGFDVSNSGIAYMTNGSSLYSVNLATGALTEVGLLGGQAQTLSIVTFAAVPAPGVCALGAGIVALGAIRRRRSQ